MFDVFPQPLGDRLKEYSVKKMKQLHMVILEDDGDTNLEFVMK